jgi:hypothetical protein
MTANDLFAAAPSLMKNWFGTSAAINSSLAADLRLRCRHEGP